MRVLSTLYVTSHRAQVKYDRGTVVVSDPERGRTRVPLESLERIVLTGHGQVTTRVLAECTSRGVRVSALAKGGRVRFVTGVPVSGNVYLRVAQLRAHEDPALSAHISRNVVAGKLQNLYAMLSRWAWDSEPASHWVIVRSRDLIGERVHNLEGCENPDRIRGIEGDATRRYFQGMRSVLSRSELPFSARTRRPPKDPVNAALSYLYGMLSIEAAGALDSIGLDPQVGFLHGLRPGRPALALDLMEEFRPSLADRCVVGMIRRRQLRIEHFEKRFGGAWYLAPEGRRVLLAGWEEFKSQDTPHPLLGRSVPRWGLMQIQATILARHLRGDLPAYAPYVMRA